MMRRKFLAVANGAPAAQRSAMSCRHRLGNMVLLRKSENGSLGNGNFASKRPVLQASTPRLTKSL